METLSGQVVDLCETRVDEYFRSKYRFLGHLPLTTVVTFAEIDLRPPTLSKQTLKYFAGLHKHYSGQVACRYSLRRIVGTPKNFQFYEVVVDSGTRFLFFYAFSYNILRPRPTKLREAFEKSSKRNKTVWKYRRDHTHYLVAVRAPK